MGMPFSASVARVVGWVEARPCIWGCRQTSPRRNPSFPPAMMGFGMVKSCLQPNRGAPLPILRPGPEPGWHHFWHRLASARLFVYRSDLFRIEHRRPIGQFLPARPPGQSDFADGIGRRDRGRNDLVQHSARSHHAANPDHTGGLGGVGIKSPQELLPIPP